MKKQICLIVAFFLVFVLVPSVFASMAVMPIVNHEAKQCAEVYGGDECSDCDVPDGWQNMDYTTGCPDEYEWLENPDLDYDCKPKINTFCCMPGHSGSRGCNLYVNFTLIGVLGIGVIVGIFFLIRFLVKKKRNS